MKRFFAFALALALVLPLLGCGEKKYPRPELKAQFPGQQVDFAFYRAYKKAYGVNPKSDEDAMNQISYSLKPAVCITLVKEFYVNLVAFLRENEMPETDIYCLLRLFEGHLNQHLGYNVESRAQINAPFFEAYRAMRKEFLAVLSRETGRDMAASYENFNLSAGENAIYGDFSYLPEEKRQFLLERAQWQNDQTALGTKVPEAS